MSWGHTTKGAGNKVLQQLRAAFVKENPAPKADHEAQFEAACHAISTVLPTLAPGGEIEVAASASGHVGKTGSSISISVQVQ